MNAERFVERLPRQKIRCPICNHQFTYSDVVCWTDDKRVFSRIAGTKDILVEIVFRCLFCGDFAFQFNENDEMRIKDESEEGFTCVRTNLKQVLKNKGITVPKSEFSPIRNTK